MQRGTHFPIIGAEQLAPAFAAGDPQCGTVPVQCWAFATVFEGTVTHTGGESEKIQGTWAGVPQSTSAGSLGGHITFAVDRLHKKITPEANPTIFPQLTKMYEPEDSVPPTSKIAVTPSGSSHPGVVGGIGAATSQQVTITAADDASGVQNIWYRFYKGDAQPPFTFVPAATTSFTLSSGAFRVEFYATDNAGNDEALHSVVVGGPANQP
jgi:hypothetical protein